MIASSMKPDILLLLTDQERFDVTHPNGPPVETPNIDRLREEGMYFERAYTPISICTSARGSLLSGLYPHNHGMLNNCHEPDAIREDFPDRIPTFGDLLADVGYNNSYLGKWHVGQNQQPEDFGFQYLGGGDGLHDSTDEGFREHQRNHDVEPDDIELEDVIYTSNPDPTLIAAKSPIPVEATRTYYLAEQTIDRLEQWVDDDGPFFHRTDFPGPHHPYTVPEPYASMYDSDDIDLWPSFQDVYGNKPQIQEKYLKYRGVEAIDEQDWRAAIAKYFGFVSFIDDQIGRILDAVDQLGLDPAIFHGSDHGDFTGSHRQFNKGPLMYEETYHIPLVVRWPGEVKPGTTSNSFVRLLDLMPTFLDMADIEPPSDIDGRSIIPLLHGNRPDDWPDSVFAEYHGDEFGLYSQRMIRTERFKFIYNTPDINELYDLERDPNELQNLVDNPLYEDTKNQLKRELVKWMDNTDDMIKMWSKKVLTS